MWSPYHNSGIAVGSVKAGGGGSLAFKTAGDWESAVIGGENKAIFGSASEVIGGTESKIVAGAATEGIFGLTSEIVLGGKLEYMKGKALALGDESVEVHKEREIQGLDSITLTAGIPAAAQAGLDSPFLPIIAMLGTIVTGAIQTVAGLKAQQSGELEGDEIQEYFKDHAEDFNATMGMECLSMVTEGLLIYGMVQAIKSKIESLETAYKTNALSTVEIGSKITMTSPSVTVTAKAGAPQTIQMDATGINLTAGAAAAASAVNIKNAGDIDITSKAAVNITSTGNTTITSTPNGKISIEQNAVTMQKTAGGQVVANATGVQIKAPNNVDAITVGNTGLQLNFNGGNLHAGPLSINPAGMIQLG